MSQKKLVVTVVRSPVNPEFANLASGHHGSRDSILKSSTEHTFYYRFLVKAGLPALEPGEIVTVQVKIKRAKAGRPKQQAVAIG